jgi:hypothetical protein
MADNEELAEAYQNMAQQMKQNNRLLKKILEELKQSNR